MYGNNNNRYTQLRTNYTNNIIIGNKQKELNINFVAAILILLLLLYYYAKFNTQVKKEYIHNYDVYSIPPSVVLEEYINILFEHNLTKSGQVDNTRESVGMVAIPLKHYVTTKPDETTECL